MSEQITEAGVTPGFLNCNWPTCPHPNPQPIASFGGAKTTKRGYQYRCKDCQKLANQRSDARRAAKPKLEVESKTCRNPKCEQINPQAASNFNATSKTRDGLMARCKHCLNAQINKRLREQRAKEGRSRVIRIIEDGVTKMRCYQCEKVYPRNSEYFHRSRQAYDGLKYHCKSCGKSAAKQFRDDNPEQYQAYNKRFYWGNRPKMLESSRLYRQANLAKAKRAGELYYLENRETLLAKNQEWRKKNPRVVSILRARRRARKNNAKGTFTDSQFLAKLDLQGYLCYYCKADLHETSYHREHKIPLASGGSNWIANLCGACPACNRRKHKKSFWVFLKLMSIDSLESGVDDLSTVVL